MSKKYQPLPMCPKDCPHVDCATCTIPGEMSAIMKRLEELVVPAVAGCDGCKGDCTAQCFGIEYAEYTGFIKAALGLKEA